MRNILITGASRGLGRALALELAAPDVQLILLARTQGALTEIDDLVRAKSGQAILVVQDLLQEANHGIEPIDVLGQALFNRLGGLDLWLHTAAALGPLTPLPHLNPADARAVWRLNADVPFRLIRSLDLLLRQKQAQALFFSCDTAFNPLPFWGAFASAKAGMEAMVTAYAKEVSAFGVRVALCDPGPMRTRLRANAFPGEDASRLPTAEAQAKKIMALINEGLEPAHRYVLHTA